STYLGGPGTDSGYAVAVDSSGNTYVTGVASGNIGSFPPAGSATVIGAATGFFAFVAKLNPSGSALVYLTLIGGSGSGTSSFGNAIAVDAAGSAYVAGATAALDFPTTSGTFDSSYNGGFSDAFAL